MNMMISASAVAVAAAPAGAASSLDPIHAAIERHKEAFRRSQETAAVRSVTIDCGPEADPRIYGPIDEAADTASAASDEAARCLTTTQPTTMAGILALIRHVEAFNAGAYFLEHDRKYGSSSPIDWPAEFNEDEIDLFSYAILNNVRRALEVITAQRPTASAAS